MGENVLFLMAVPFLVLLFRGCIQKWAKNKTGGNPILGIIYDFIRYVDQKYVMSTYCSPLFSEKSAKTIVNIILLHKDKCAQT